MRRIYITFSGSAYHETTELIVERAPKLGADEVWVYDDAWLMKQEFYELNKWLWDCPATDDPKRRPRGFGWFCWKPFIIQHALNRLSTGDMVLYTDADTYPINNFSVLYDRCREDGGIMAFAAEGIENWMYTKWDCFLAMGLEHFWTKDTNATHAKHAVARFMVFEKGSYRVQQFLAEWQTYCLNRNCQTFDPSIITGALELSGFKEHRTEQSIYTLLCHKYGLNLYREACQFGEWSDRDRDLYPQLFEQVGTARAKTLAGSEFANID